MSDKSTAAIAGVSGVLGALLGSAIAAFSAVKVSEVQMAQATLTTRASSALSMRATLAEKAAPFFAANEEFQESLEDGELDHQKITNAASKARNALSQLYPYVDGDLLVACYGISLSITKLVSPGDVDRKKALDSYWSSYKDFQNLYLRLRRELEKNAQVEVFSSQINPDSSKSSQSKAGAEQDKQG